jgi:hypothetical protein
VADAVHILQEGITAIRKHPGGDPRMRLEGFLVDFVSNLVNNSERVDIEAGCLVPHSPPSVRARESTRSVAGCNQVLWQVLPRVVGLRQSSYVSSLHSSTPYLKPDLPAV